MAKRDRELATVIGAGHWAINKHANAHSINPTYFVEKDVGKSPAWLGFARESASKLFGSNLTHSRMEWMIKKARDNESTPTAAAFVSRPSHLLLPPSPYHFLFPSPSHFTNRDRKSVV